MVSCSSAIQSALVGLSQMIEGVYILVMSIFFGSKFNLFFLLYFGKLSVSSLSL